MESEWRSDVTLTRSFVTRHGCNNKDDVFMFGRGVEGVDWVSNDTSLEKTAQLSCILETWALKLDPQTSS